MSEVQLFSAQFVTLASLAALSGAALAILSESRRAPRARWIALALCVPLAIPPLVWVGGGAVLVYLFVRNRKKAAP